MKLNASGERDDGGVDGGWEREREKKRRGQRAASESKGDGTKKGATGKNDVVEHKKSKS